MSATAIVWFRRDLRLADNPALNAAISRGFQPLLVYIDDPEGEGGWPLGGAARAWLARSLRALAADIKRLGGELRIARGDSQELLLRLIAASSAKAVFWNRRYEPFVRERDSKIKQALIEQGVECESFNAALLNEPWTIANKQGKPYRVFTPYWRSAVEHLETLPPPLPAPRDLDCANWPAALPEASVDAPTPSWDVGFWEQAKAGEQGAEQRLGAFLQQIEPYSRERDFPARDSTSRLSPHLAFGEISPRQIVSAVREAGLREAAAPFVRELGWREFSYHLLFHFPHSVEKDLSTQMQHFDWAVVDPERLSAWQQGRTGIPMIDAAMRELWHTGIMHNRCRMLVASFLTKNLRYHWLHGARWFWDTLVDADLANNTQGWQWSAGTGADAAPYFRIFNPVTQGQRFDPDGAYVKHWLPQLRSLQAAQLHSPWTVKGLKLSEYPMQPLVDLKLSRAEALDQYRSARQ